MSTNDINPNNEDFTIPLPPFIPIDSDTKAVTGPNNQQSGGPSTLPESATVSVLLNGTNTLTQTVTENNPDPSLEGEGGDEGDAGGASEISVEGESQGQGGSGAEAGDGDDDEEEDQDPDLSSQSIGGAPAGVLQIGESAAGASESFYVSLIGALTQAQNSLITMKELDSEMMGTTANAAASETITAANADAQVYTDTAYQSFATAGTTFAGAGIGWGTKPSSQSAEDNLKEQQAAQSSVVATKNALEPLPKPPTPATPPTTPTTPSSAVSGGTAPAAIKVEASQQKAAQESQINTDQATLKTSGALKLETKEEDTQESKTEQEGDLVLRKNTAVSQMTPDDKLSFTTQSDKNDLVKYGTLNPKDPVTGKNSTADELTTRQGNAETELSTQDQASFTTNKSLVSNAPTEDDQQDINELNTTGTLKPKTGETDTQLNNRIATTKAKASTAQDVSEFGLTGTLKPKAGETNDQLKTRISDTEVIGRASTTNDRSLMLRDGDLGNQKDATSNATIAKQYMTPEEKISVDKINIQKYGHIRIDRDSQGNLPSQSEVQARTNAAVKNMTSDEQEKLKTKIVPGAEETTKKQVEKAQEAHTSVLNAQSTHTQWCMQMAGAVGQSVSGGLDIMIAQQKSLAGTANAYAILFKGVMDSVSQMFSSINQQATQLAQEAVTASSSQTSISQNTKV